MNKYMYKPFAEHLAIEKRHTTTEESPTTTEESTRFGKAEMEEMVMMECQDLEVSLAEMVR